MIKIFFLLMIMSTPNQTTVKYNAAIYPTEALCMEARVFFFSLTSPWEKNSLSPYVAGV